MLRRQLVRHRGLMDTAREQPNDMKVIDVRAFGCGAHNVGKGRLGAR